MTETQDKTNDQDSSETVEVESVTPNGRITYDILSILKSPNAIHHFSVLDSTISLVPSTKGVMVSTSPETTADVGSTGVIIVHKGAGHGRSELFTQRKKSPQPSQPKK